MGSLPQEPESSGMIFIHASSSFIISALCMGFLPEESESSGMIFIHMITFIYVLIEGDAIMFIQNCR